MWTVQRQERKKPKKQLTTLHFDMLVLKFVESQGTQYSQNNLEKKKKSSSRSYRCLFLTLNLTTKLQCGNGIRINTENNRIKSPEINAWSCSQLTSGERAMAIQQRKNTFFYKWCWDNWKITWTRMKLNLTLHHIQKLIHMH